MFYKLDENNKPIKTTMEDLLTWGASHEKIQAGLGFSIARTEIEDVLISTVFLVIDHNFSDDGDPVLWETMVFGGKQDQYQERYTSHEDALAGHDRICKMCGVKR